MKSISTGSHGQIRGLESTQRSPQFEGRFGRMFPTLQPAHFDAGDLRSLASAMIATREPPQTPETEVDPIDGRIVGEVFVGLLLGDRQAFLNQEPLWHPISEFTNDGQFDMAELITQAVQA